MQRAEGLPYSYNVVAPVPHRNEVPRHYELDSVSKKRRSENN